MARRPHRWQGIVKGLILFDFGGSWRVRGLFPLHALVARRRAFLTPRPASFCKNGCESDPFHGTTPPRTSVNPRKLVIALVLLAGVAAFFALDLGRYLQPGLHQGQPGRHSPPCTRSARCWWRCVFFGVYVGVTALSLPGAAIMTLAGGADLRPGVGHGARVVRLDPRRHAGLAGRALPAARRRPGALRPTAGRGRTRASSATAPSTCSRCG